MQKLLLLGLVDKPVAHIPFGIEVFFANNRAITVVALQFSEAAVTSKSRADEVRMVDVVFVSKVTWSTPSSP